MSVIYQLWKILTPTLALENSSGKFETAFFENVYRVIYLSGLSLHDTGPLYLIYSYTVKFFIFVIVSSGIWFLLSQSSNLDVIITSMCCVLIQLIALYRYQSMVNHMDTYKKLSMAMKSPYFDISTPQRTKIVNACLKTNDNYFKLLLALGNCTLAAWNIYPLVDDIEYNLMVNVRLLFDYQTDYLYPITYVFIATAFYYTATFVMVNDLIMQAHLIHLLCQFLVLKDCFQNIVSECAAEFPDLNEDKVHLNETFVAKYTDKLRSYVEQHRFVLSLSLELREVLCTPMLAQLAISSMLICFTAYQVTATVTAGITKFLMSLLYLGYNMFELFIFCFWCDEIKSESENIRDSVYFSGWECGIGALPHVRLRLMLVAARASRPVVLTAGGLYDLSLASFTTLVKTSYSALTVLLRVDNE